VRVHDDVEDELLVLLRRTGSPYSDGWVEVVAGKGKAFVAYDAITRVEVV